MDGAVIVLSHFCDIKLSSALEIECGAGIKLSKLCSFALENSLSGAEFAWGIPGTVGGAIYMNAGAYGSEICNIISECTYIDEEGQLVTADVSAGCSCYTEFIDGIFCSCHYVRMICQTQIVIGGHIDDFLTVQNDSAALRGG